MIGNDAWSLRRRRREDYINLSKSRARLKSATEVFVGEAADLFAQKTFISPSTSTPDRQGLLPPDPTPTPLKMPLLISPHRSVTSRGVCVRQCVYVCLSAAHNTCSHCCGAVRSSASVRSPPSATVATHLCDFTPPRKEINATLRSSGASRHSSRAADFSTLHRPSHGGALPSPRWSGHHAGLSHSLIGVMGALVPLSRSSGCPLPVISFAYLARSLTASLAD